MEVQGNDDDDDKVADVKCLYFQTKDNRLCVYACDFFSVTPEMIGEVDAVYDRCACVGENEIFS